MTAVLHTDPQVLRGSIAAPQPTSPAAEPFADAASAILLLALALLHEVSRRLNWWRSRCNLIHCF